MTVQDIRLRCLELARPQSINNPDAELWVERARLLEAYVCEGQAIAPPAKRRGRPPKNPPPETSFEIGAVGNGYSE